ncbi:MAG TPA: ABC transporter substrate-binding protein [Bryobacteraceae bacterium]|jgi:peptide/nickel transport system substrate-binding protein|nr:ABC transporter substrate-binding protein [Bryobacteraceae bacterium]
MNRSWRTSNLPAVVVLLTGALVSGGALQAGQRRELRLAIPSEPKTFDALQVSEQSSELIRYLTGGVLVRVNRATDQLQPELAESWKASDGGRTVTFHLRDGLKFSDGKPLGAADVARTLNAALDPKLAAPVGDTFRTNEGNPEIRVASPRDITIHYARPKPGIDRLFDSLAIVPANAGKLPASAGPWFVEGYQPGDYIRLARNPWYWKHDSRGRQLPYLDSIRIDIQPNRDIQLTRFLRGELHVLENLNPESFDRVGKAQPQAARNLGASLDSEFLWFNESPGAAVPDWKKKWFTSAVFRHAVSMAMSRDDIARIVYRGHAHPALGPISPSNRFWFNPALKPLPLNPQAAVRSLAAEGFTLGDGVLRDHDGHPVEFSLITNTGNRSREAMAAVIQEDLRAIGMRVNLVTLDFSSLIERITRTSQYEAGLLGLANIEIDPSAQMNVWLSSGEMHAWWPSQKTPATQWEANIDRLVLQQASEPSPELRKKAFDEVQRIVAEREPIIYLVNPDCLTAISPSLHGVQPSATPPHVLWNSEWLWLE